MARVQSEPAGNVFIDPLSQVTHASKSDLPLVIFSIKTPRPRLALPLVLALALAALGGACHHPSSETPRATVTPLLRPPLTPLFDDLEKRTFDYFWDTAMPDNGLIPDRYPYIEPFSSVAAIGFGLTAYGIGVERKYIARESLW